jgi:hypothetical protein
MLLYCKLCIYALFLCFLASCSSGSKPKPVEPEPDLHQSLDAAACANADDFRGIGIGSNENDALAQARSNMAQEHFVEKLKSSVDIGGQNINGVASTNTYINIKQNAKLLNPSDAKLHYSKRQGEQTGVVACMTKADAAKSYVNMQSQLLDSLEFIAANELKATYPKQKSDARVNANTLWSKMLANHELLKSWKIEGDITRAKDIHDAVEDDYKDYCGAAKLHWNTEKETIYSELAFSKLSGSIKIEKSPCVGRGVSLAYKGSELECSVEFGLNTCFYAQSLSIRACDGTEYLQLKNDAMGAHQKPEFALDKLQNNFKSVEFWNQWIQEIKQWSPQCE